MEDLLGLLIFIFVDILCVWTGEIVKFVFSFGKYKPSFDRSIKSYSISSLFLGVVFWILVGVGISVVLI